MKATTTADCSINAMNNKAIGLVKNGEGRNAVKLFLQALSSLKSEIKCQTKCSGSECHSHMDDNESPLIRISVEAKKEMAGMATYDCFFGLNPKTNPCTPQHRDGSTACLLYNMAVTEHKMGLQHQDTKARQGFLKKAMNIYNMAFSAAQHWKKYTEQHSGCQILCLAILNNLLTIHNELHNASKVAQLHTVLRDTLFSNGKGDEITSEELSLFAKNLQLCSNDSGSDSSSVPTSSDATLPQHTEQVA